MFKQRLITALVLIPLVLLAIYRGPQWLLGLFMVLFIIGAGWEWLQLIPLTSVSARMGFIGIASFGMLILLIYPVLLLPWLCVGLTLWLLILLAVVIFPKGQVVWGRRAIVGALGMILLPLAAVCMERIYVYPRGPDWIVCLFCLIWSVDIGAYLVGKRWGRHKLIRNVSPGKTIEGALGGLMLALIVGGIGYVVLDVEQLAYWFVMVLMTALMAMLGDLFISMLKRRCHLKDTGTLFPGHGGVLDRLDSLLAAAPIFYMGLRFLMYWM